MKYIQINHQYKKIVAAVFGLAAMMLLAMSGNSLAQDYVSIKIYPEHVGVFTTVGTQQFVAFGIAASGNTTNITKDVSWESSDPNIVTIDANGLATIVAGKTMGQVKITCSYPKTGGLPLSSINLLLSGNSTPVTYTVTADVNGTSTGTGSMASLPGGIAYTYPTDNTATTTPINAGNAVALTATADAGSAASWDDCVAAGGTAFGDGTNEATCAFASLDGDKTVTATFTLGQYTVTADAAGAGTGSVSSNVGGISYTHPPVDTQDSTGLNPGSSIIITAAETAGGTVTWGGTCAAAGGNQVGNGGPAAVCTIGSLNGDKTVTATFTAAP